MKYQPFSVILLLALFTSALGLLSGHRLKAVSSQVAQISSQTDSQLQADQLFHTGLDFYQSNQIEDAIQAWQQALAIYQAIQNPYKEGVILGNLIAAYMGLEDYPSAIEVSQRALTLAREIDDVHLQAHIHGSLGLVFYWSHRFEEAVQALQQALTLYRKMQDQLGEADILRNLAATYIALENYPSAIEVSQQALKLAEETEDVPMQAHVLGNLAAAYIALGNSSSAIEVSQQSLRLARHIDNVALQAQALGNLGRALYQSNQLEAAIQTLEQALTLYEAVHDLQEVGNTLRDLAAAHIALGNYTTAIEFSERAIPIAQEIEDVLVQINALSALGSVYRGLGDYSRALKSHQQALTIAQQLEDPTEEAYILDSLGNVYVSLGDYTWAIDFYQQSLAIARQVKDQAMETMALGNLGAAYAALGKYDQAIAFHRESLAIAQAIEDATGVAYAFNNLGSIYHHQANLEQAVNYYQQSLEIAQAMKLRRLQAEILTSLGTASEQLGAYETAIAQHEESLAISKQVKDPDLEGKILNNLGHTLMEADQLQAAEQRLRQAITTLSALREGLEDAYNRSLFDTQIHTYNLLQQILVKQSQYEAALEAAEQGRARAFVSLLINRLDRQQALSAADQLPSLAQIKQVARRQSATLVEYTIVPDDQFMFPGKRRGPAAELYIWVVQPTGAVTFRSIDLRREDLQLEEVINVSRDAIGVRSRGGLELALAAGVDHTQQLRTLHQLLIQPIDDLLPTNPNDLVVFIPQDDLFMVPFPALQDANGHYLIEQHAMLTAPAIQVLDLTRKQREQLLANGSTASGQAPQRDEILIVGNPVMPSVWVSPQEPKRQLSNLPGAEQEALAIAEFFNTQALVGSQATESILKQQMPRARVIHFATHGLLEYGQPQDSGVQDLPGAIALAPGDGEDGLLTAAEIFDLSLRTELVVLSACDTGLGQISEGGVVGLSRSLIKAGASSVIVSLWAVPDAPTAALMTEFYRQWQSGLNKAHALRQAMLTTMEMHPDPRDWAAFTLIGEVY